jgi:hypothetical protein
VQVDHIRLCWRYKLILHHIKPRGKYSRPCTLTDKAAAPALLNSIRYGSKTGARYKEISSQLLRYPYMRCHPIRNPHTPETPCSRLVGNDLPLHEMCAESCSLTGSCTNYCFFAGSRRGDCSLISMLKAPKPRFSKLDILRAVHPSARLTQPRVLLKAVIREVVATKHCVVFRHYLHAPQ